MSLTIKRNETHRLARQLATLTGESMTTAVTVALRERLERVRRNSRRRMAERLMKIGRECAAHIKEPFKSMNPDELLYGKKGMPK